MSTAPFWHAPPIERIAFRARDVEQVKELPPLNEPNVADEHLSKSRGPGLPQRKPKAFTDQLLGVDIGSSWGIQPWCCS